MKIQSVRIKNFRALKDVEIPFDAVTTFIGPNGVGKSTVLNALDWFFNGKPAVLEVSDRFFGVMNENIEVSVTFTDLSAKDLIELGKYVPEGVGTFTAWRTCTPDGTDTFSANAKSFPSFNPIKSAASATERKKKYNELRTTNPDLGLPAVHTGSAVIEAMTAWEAQNPERLADAPESLQTNFFGFNSGGKMSGLFDFVLVKADLRASEEATDDKSSIIGRILERTVDRSVADDRIVTIVNEAKLKQQEVYDESFGGQLDSMIVDLNALVESYSPGRSVTVSPAAVELKAPKTTFNVAVLDGPTETAVERQGHGFQRTMLIAALQLLAQSGAASENGVICLAIEEPELFQHPIQAQAFARVLRSLAEDRSKRIQVTYATHSPYFLEPRYFHQVRRLSRVAGGPPLVSIHFGTVEGIKSRLEGIVTPGVVDRRLDHNVAEQLATALFAKTVLLVEGSTESAVFYGLGDRESPGSLEAAGIAIVPAGSKGSITLAHAILSALGVPVYALFDSDAGFEERARAAGKDPKKIDEERQNHVSENKKLLRYFGMPLVDFPPQTVSGSVAIFADHLESFMENSWPAWAVACGEIEKKLGISRSKNTLVYRAATLEAEGQEPSMLLEILRKVTA